MALAEIRRVLCVHSCKGGVGKSVTAVGLARALNRRGGQRVGLLDADVHGPSVAIILGMREDAPQLSADEGFISPLESAEGLLVQSSSFVQCLWDRRLSDGSIVLRGGLVNEILSGMANYTAWGRLDTLVVDMPPGTGDLPQTIIELLPVDGVVVVSTPHVLAVRDTIKGVEMLNKLCVPVSALVQNMSILACEACGSQSHPFGDTAEQRLLDLCGPVPFVHFPIVRDGGLGTALETYFDSLAAALVDAEGSSSRGVRPPHLLPTAAAFNRYAPPHWPTLMACAKLVLK